MNARQDNRSPAPAVRATADWPTTRPQRTGQAVSFDASRRAANVAEERSARFQQQSLQAILDANRLAAHREQAYKAGFDAGMARFGQRWFRWDTFALGVLFGAVAAFVAYRLGPLVGAWLGGWLT